MMPMTPSMAEDFLSPSESPSLFFKLFKLSTSWIRSVGEGVKRKAGGDLFGLNLKRQTMPLANERLIGYLFYFAFFLSFTKKKVFWLDYVYVYRIHDHHDKDWPAPKEELSDNRGCRKENDDKVFKFLLCFLLLYTNEYINFYQEYITHMMIRINNKWNREPEGDDSLFKLTFFFPFFSFFLDY